MVLFTYVFIATLLLLCAFDFIISIFSFFRGKWMRAITNVLISLKTILWHDGTKSVEQLFKNICTNSIGFKLLEIRLCSFFLNNNSHWCTMLYISMLGKIKIFSLNSLNLVKVLRLLFKSFLQSVTRVLLLAYGLLQHR